MSSARDAARAVPPDVQSAVVLYHHPCHDGCHAALAAWQHFRGMPAALRFVPHRVYEPLQSTGLGLSRNDTVFLLDYVGPPGFAQALADVAGR